MNDERFDELIEKASSTYRVPPEPPVDEMWAAIEAGLGTERDAIGATAAAPGATPARLPVAHRRDRRGGRAGAGRRLGPVDCAARGPNVRRRAGRAGILA